MNPRPDAFAFRPPASAPFTLPEPAVPATAGTPLSWPSIMTYGWAVTIFIANFSIIESWGFFYSHLILLISIGFLIAKNFMIDKKLDYTKELLIACAIMFSSIGLSVLRGRGDMFVTSTIKGIIYVFGAIVFSNNFSRQALANMLKLMPVCVVILLGIKIAQGSFNFEYAGRFQVDDFASPNALGSILNVCLIVVVQSDFARTRVLDALIRLVLLASLVPVILLTFSRAAMVAAGAAIALFTKRTQLIILMVLGIAAGVAAVTFIDMMPNSIVNVYERTILQKGNIVEDISGTGGSDRIPMWGIVLTRYIDNPSGWLFGFGPGNLVITRRELGVFDYPGAIDFYHAHNTYITILYEYGIVGLVAVLSLYFKAISRYSKSTAVDRLACSLAAFYVIDGMSDYHLMGAPSISYHCMCITYCVKALIYDGRPAASPASEPSVVSPPSNSLEVRNVARYR